MRSLGRRQRSASAELLPLGRGSRLTARLSGRSLALLSHFSYTSLCTAMAQKRTASDMDTEKTTVRPRRESTKRTRLVPKNERDADSSAPSSCSVSVDSALQSSPSASGKDRQSSMSSLDTADGSDESMSSVSSDSESGNDDEISEDEDDVATIRTQKKPDFTAPSLGGAGDLQARLRAFLPQMADANSKLATDGAARFSMEDVGEEEPHIEMNLGLGVLEEQGEGGSESSEDEDDQEEQDEEMPLASDGPRKEKDVMGRLMGGREPRKGGVEEVG